MMNNLFSMFDPSSNILNLNWTTLLIPLILINKKYYFNMNRDNFLMTKINMLIFKDINQTINKNHMKSCIIFISLFTFIYMNNLISLNPFIFTPTSHLSLSLFLSTPLWLSFNLKGWMKNMNYMLIHMVPMGTPMLLTSFMVLIETTSTLIRPMTLSIRLTANMIAGHILIALLSNLLNTNIFIFILTSLVLNLLMILEMSVSMIQAYVFIILLILYLNDIK